MNFLALAQRVRQEAEIPGTGPSSVDNQTGQLKRVVDWTASAWEDIQNLETDWRWMRRPFTFDTVANTDNYAYGSVTDVDAGAAISRFGHWWVNDEDDWPLCYLQSGGVGQQYRLEYLPWEDWKWLYRFGTQNASQPIHISVDHQNRVCLGPKPNDVYVVTGDFQRSMQTLSLDADIPEMPTQYHMLVVYWALEKYGANAVAGEIVARAQKESRRLLSALRMDQLPAAKAPAPLV